MRAKLEKSSHFVVGSLLWWLLPAGCATAPVQVASLARHDLGCPTAHVVPMPPGRYAASGCGLGAVYARVCDGTGCRWGRLRHGHEAALAAQTAAGKSSGVREVIPAPNPGPRNVMAAPSPAVREVLAAPPPPDTQQAPPADTDGGSPPPTAAPAPVPLSQGAVSTPYEALVPERPVEQRSAAAPPQPLIDERPAAPPNYQWVGGYWFWGATGWVWLPGYWSAPVIGYAYQPGYWYWSSSYWWYWPGGWSRPGATTVVYQTRPRTQRVVRVRSFAPRPAGTAAFDGSHARASYPAAVRPSPSPSGFRPSSPTLLGYPTASREGSVRVASPGRPAASPIGRLVRPGAVPPRPSRFASSRPSRGGSSGGDARASSARFQSRVGFTGGGRSFAPYRSAPSSRVPPVGRARRR